MEILIKKNDFFRKLQGLLFGLVIVCIPFQDFILQETILGDFGRYLSNIPLVLVVFCSLVRMFLCKNVYRKEYIYYIITLLYIIIYSLIILIKFIDNIYLDLYLYKVFSNLILFFLWGYVYIYVKYINIEFLKKYIIIAYVIHIIGWFLHDILKINLGYIRVTNSVESMRYSGFLSEASVFCFTTIILGLLTAYYIKNKFVKFLIVFVSLVIATLGGSKGTIICLVISIIMLVLLNSQINRLKKMIVVLLLSILGAYSIYYFVSDSFIVDLEEYTSFATRMSSIISAGFILVEYPLGTGFGAFIPIYQNILGEAFDFLNSYMISIPLNYNEIMNIILAREGKSVTIKNIVFQYIAYFGIPFIVVFFKYVKVNLYLLMLKKNYYLLFSFIFIIFSLITFANIGYAPILMLGLISNKISRKG